MNKKLPVMDLGEIVRTAKEIGRLAKINNNIMDSIGEPHRKYFHSPFYTAVWTTYAKMEGPFPEKVSLSAIPTEDLKATAIHAGFSGFDLLFAVGMHARAFGYSIVDEKFADTMRSRGIPLWGTMETGYTIPLPLQIKDYSKKDLPRELQEDEEVVAFG